MFPNQSKGGGSSDRIDDQPSFKRGGGAGPHALENSGDDASNLGGFGHSGQQGVPGGSGGGTESSALPGNPHSISGFRRSIEHQQNHPSSGRGAHGSRLASRVKNFAQARGPKFGSGGGMSGANPRI